MPDGAVQCSKNPPKWTRDASKANLNPSFAHMEVRQNGFEAQRINGEAMIVLDTVDASSGAPARASFLAEGNGLHQSDSLIFEIKGMSGGWIPFERLGGNFAMDTVRSPVFDEKVMLRARVKHGMKGGGPNMERQHRVERIQILREKALSSPRITPEDPTICAGECVDLTFHPGFHASSYLWSPAKGLNAQTGQTVTACPSSTTTYSVIATGTTVGGTPQFAFASVTVEVEEAFLSILNTNYPQGNDGICVDPGSPGCATISVLKGAKSSIDVSPSPQSINCIGNGFLCEVEVCPAQSTTYTITVTDPSNHCSNKEKVSIDVKDCRCEQEYTKVLGPAGGQTKASNLPPNYFQNANIEVKADHTLIFDGINPTISGCRMKMGKGASIVVDGDPTPNTLTITEGNNGDPTQIFSCSEMWKGIKVVNGGVTAEKSTLIEDALNAVHLKKGVQNGLVLDNAHLNKNLTHVRTEATSNGFGTFSITGTEFSCEPVRSPGFLLKPPHSDKVTRTGVFLGPNEQNNVQIGDPNASENSFSRARRGIVGEKATFTAKNNTFQNIRPFKEPCELFHLPDGEPIGCGTVRPGVAILGYQNFTTLVPPDGITPPEIANATIKGNRFFDCRTAVRTDNYKDVKVRNNEIDQEEVSLNDKFYPFQWWLLKGKMGIRIKEYNAQKYDSDFVIENNQIRDQQRSILVQYVQEPQNSELSIRDNIIKAPDAGNIPSLDQPTNARGIMVTAVNPAATTTDDSWWVASNDIQDVMEGIHMNNIKNHLKRVVANDVIVDPLPNTGNDTVNRENAGIRLVKTSSAVNVEGNELSGSIAPSGPGTPFLHKGYVGEFSHVRTMKCNEFENIGEAFHFYNNNTYYTSIRLNDILPSYHRGVVLSNGGNIGPQGADLSGNQTDAPTFNEWKQIPTDVTFKGQQRKGYTTYSQFGSNSGGNSVFYVRNDPDENPPSSLEKVLSLASKPLKTLKVDNPAPYDPVCPIYEGDIELEESDDQREKMVRDIAGDSLSYGYAPTGSRLWAVHQAYRMIKNDSSLPGNDSLLIAFEDSLDKTKIGECREVDRKREAGQIGQANSINNSITCQTPWVETLRTFNEIYLASWESGNGLSQQQVTTLWDLANKCPVTHGPGVYRSRNMLRYLADSTLRFEADCPKPGPSEEKSAGRGADTGGTRARWAPNPSKGASTLHYKLQKEHAGAVLILWNSNGELVERSTLEDVEGAKSLDLSERKSGIYLYQIRKDGRSLESGKLLLKR